MICIYLYVYIYIFSCVLQIVVVQYTCNVQDVKRLERSVPNTFSGYGYNVAKCCVASFQPKLFPVPKSNTAQPIHGENTPDQIILLKVSSCFFKSNDSWLINSSPSFNEQHYLTKTSFFTPPLVHTSLLAIQFNFPSLL